MLEPTLIELVPIRAPEIMRHVTQWLRSTHPLCQTKRNARVLFVRLLGFGDSISYLHRPGLLSDLLDGHHRGLGSGNSTSMEHLKATLDIWRRRHHAMSRTHHNHYALTCPLQPEVLIDLSDSAYPLYAYTALHYRPLHGSGVLLGGDQGWLLLAAEDHNRDIAADVVSSVMVSMLASARADTEGTNGSLNPFVEIEINGTDSVQPAEVAQSTVVLDKTAQPKGLKAKASRIQPPA
ncbi:unnamed protein product [Spirodela intermedia]|uniref:Uncharacterized protein n=1 Tax=Spirodela intermedia TaxID=51605 RepID=A0ABN7ED73_SPIIN|nr:unnamed protein product [Spirodela intermedia]